MSIGRTLSFFTYWGGRLSLLSCILVLCLLTACSTGPSSLVQTTASTEMVDLNQLHWCDKTFIVFSDQKGSATATQSAGTNTPGVEATPTAAPKTISDWQQVKPQLGFDVYLPPTLPKGSCLIGVSGTLNDPIFGSSFSINYLMPDHNAVSLAEAPLKAQSADFQCSPSESMKAQPDDKSAKGTPTATSKSQNNQLCSSAKNKTSITFSAQGSDSQMKQFFDSLQSGVNWTPAGK